MMDDQDLLRSLPAEKIQVLRGALGRRGGVKTRGGRLPPISARALGLTTSKKSFAPSIPQRRVKQEKEDADEFRVERGAERQKRGRDRGRGRGRGRGNYIQTTGSLFGEGVTKTAENKPASDTGYTKLDTTPVMPVFTPIKLKTRAEMEEEENMLKKEDEFVYDSDDDEEEYAAIRLPFVHCGELKTEETASVKLKKEPKEEALDASPVFCDNKDGKLLTEFVVKKEPGDIDEKDIKPSLFEDSGLFLIQFPSCAFFKNLKSRDPEKVAESNSSQNEDQDTEYEEECRLSDMPDGLIGKIRIFRSGAMKFMFGSTEYFLKTDPDIIRFQQLISLDESGVAVLDEVNKLLVCVPDLPDSLPVNS